MADEKLKLFVEVRKEEIKGRTRIIWDINPDSEILFTKLIMKKNYASGEFDYLVKEYKDLPDLVKHYLKIIAESPLWRNNHWCENHNTIEWDWRPYKKAKEKSMKFNLNDIGNGFIEYLFVNKRKIRKKYPKFKLDKFITWAHLSRDPMLLHYLQDKSL